ncbi:MAG TPA: DUF5686 family protein [Bacteroidales bacterium]|nr:DUF5686 family protein [Bacteroidales bacterium]HSA43397.1 DUF5686 family protein [Bacteroidales bacterium]
MILLVFCARYVGAQDYRVYGRITDEESGEPLAFVSLVFADGRFGGYSDIDGKYQLRSATPFPALKASYVGYKAREIRVGKSGRLDFTMQKTTIELPEVVIQPKENPAHRLILKALEMRDRNNPFKLSSFSYTAYEKLVFTSDLDSIARADTSGQDSSMMEARKFFDNQYFALIENVVERSFKAPAKSFQKVIATKISGLKDPIFVFLLSQLQPVSFYDEIIPIGNLKLINPLSKGSVNKYFFLISDTIINEDQHDTTYVIYFRPYKGTNFEGLSGLLYITSDGWAIRNVIAEPKREEGGLGIKIQQMYEKVDGEHWFPVQLNTDLTFRGVELIVGQDSARRYHVIGKGRSYLRDIVINGQVQKKFNQVEIFIDPDASRREEAYWNSFRTDSLTLREQRTYAFMDSLGEAEKFDAKARNLETMMTGRIPIGYFDVEMNKLFRYNDFEKTYLGLGLVTNRRWSEWWNISGYWGYGFRDKKSKYGGSLSVFPWPAAELEWRLSYTKDVRESGGVNLFDEKGVAMYERFRYYLIRNMDYVENRQASLSFRTLQYLKLFTAINQTVKTTGQEYFFSGYKSDTYTLHPSFHFTEVLTGLRFAYREKFLKNARTQISLGTNYPIVIFQISRGLDKVLGSDFEYHKMDLKITKSFYLKYLGKTSVCLNMGLAEGSLPYTELYNGNGSYRQFTIYTPNSFATMRMNEFLSDRYVAVYLTHNFSRLLFRTKYFQPEVAIATNLAFGSLADKEVHHLVAFRTMEKGYFESGLLLNNLLNIQFTGIGVGAYYRYGSYAFRRWQDNLSLKFSLMLPF